MTLYASTSDSNKKPSSSNYEYTSYKGPSLQRLSQVLYFHTCAPTVWITLNSASNPYSTTRYKIYATANSTLLQTTFTPVSSLGYIFIRLSNF